MRFVYLTSLVLLVSITIQAAIPPQSSVDADFDIDDLSTQNQLMQASVPPQSPIDAAFDINDLSILDQLVQARATIDPRVIQQVILAKKIQRVLEEEASGTESPANQDKINKKILAHLLRDEEMYQVVQALMKNKSVQERMQGILLVPNTARTPIGEMSSENVARWLSQVRDTSVPPLSSEEKAMIERVFGQAVPEPTPRKSDFETSDSRDPDWNPYRSYEYPYRSYEYPYRSYGYPYRYYGYPYRYYGYPYRYYGYPYRHYGYPYPEGESEGYE
ncbi:hypothetical protein BZG36_03525 [Bifiguratus adelaidae]|uniref:Uncharacterized protein n=1 Tax=Bifiguratus adelaidae TaxID=1938954 RepID=A0A261XZ91_9FUNG|nr:hypothetical protein BZG36_03525 [Bifiguratus adelaidae]